MKLEHLYYFLTVADCGSISKAAEKLFLKRNNLSTIISNFENEFSTQLLLRTSKGCVLTLHGEKVYTWAHKVLEEKQLLQKIFSDENKQLLSGELFIYTTPAISGTSYFNFYSEFLSENPQITLHIQETGTINMIKYLSNNPNRIGILVTNTQNLSQIKQNTTLTFIELQKLSLLAYVAKSSPWTKIYASISLKNLTGLPILLYSPTSIESHPILNDFLSKNFEFKNLTTVSNLSLFHELLKTGRYVTIGTECSTLSSDMNDFIPITIRDNIKLSHIILINKNDLQNPTISHFISSYQKIATHSIKKH